LIQREAEVVGLTHHPIRKWGVSNYFFWEEIGVLAPEIFLERKRFEGEDAQKEISLRHSRTGRNLLPQYVPYRTRPRKT
jgi:hypothetical protein